MTVSPCIKELPTIYRAGRNECPSGLKVEMRPLNPKHLVLTLLLTNVHRYYFCHSATRRMIEQLAKAAREATLLPSSVRMSGNLAAHFLGIKECQRDDNTIRHVLGSPGSVE